MRTAALEPAIRRAATRPGAVAGEPCAFCAVPLADHHPHLLDAATRRPLCVCQACSLLFDRPIAADGRFVRIPDRRAALSGVAPAALGVPVGLAFFVLGSDGEVSAHYPSPGGATRWEVDSDVWDRVVEDCPTLRELAADVEALLVNTVRGRSEAWIVPVTDCYRLVALVREQWEGLYGGDHVWPAIEEFFSELRRNDGTYSRR